MTDRDLLIQHHGFLSDLAFRLKAAVLILLRSIRNSTLDRTIKFRVNYQLKNEGVISFSETDLWNPDDTEKNWILTAGKIQNLRIAAKRLHGTEVPANEVFSFWKHIGAPVTSRGYVIGREIREGCIVPAVAGGLCQLSNALYDNALKAGFEIVERHKHTKVIKGSLAEIDRDATVKWNYIDLRFRSAHAFRIEAELTADKLIVRFKSSAKRSDHNGIPKTFITPSQLNDCYSCGNFECFKHPGETNRKERASATTFILDEKWTEYEDYIKSIATPNDRFIAPLMQSRLRRSFMMRFSSKLGRNIFATLLKLDKSVARKMIKHIPIGSTHLVISQNLLPFVMEHGALGGRTFDVLMTRLPIEKLHERLDLAHKKYPHSPTLNDFRAPADLLDIENTALTKARHIITPHIEIAEIFRNKSIRLPWKYPRPSNRQRQKGNKVLFPASALARKGAYEMRQLAKDLGLSVRILGNATEDQSFWDGVNTERTQSDPFDNIALIVYPTYIEHQPRVLLRAIAAGIPIVTTTASGLSESENVTIVETGDYTALKEAVINRGLFSKAG